MNQYLEYLKNQFRSAKGIKSNDLLSKQFLQEFYAWIDEQQLIGEKYLKMIDHMNMEYDCYNCAEVGKGIHDSIVKNFSTKIITPYARSFKVVRHGLYDGRVYVSGEKPLIKLQNEGTRTLSVGSIRLFMTQNPYDSQCISNWNRLANNSVNGIIVGMYGNIHDKDRMEKLQILNNLRKSIWQSVEIGYDFDDEYYMYAIGSSLCKKK